MLSLSRPVRLSIFAVTVCSIAYLAVGLVGLYFPGAPATPATELASVDAKIAAATIKIPASEARTDPDVDTSKITPSEPVEVAALPPPASPVSREPEPLRPLVGTVTQDGPLASLPQAERPADRGAPPDAPAVPAAVRRPLPSPPPAPKKLLSAPAPPQGAAKQQLSATDWRKEALAGSSR